MNALGEALLDVVDAHNRVVGRAPRAEVHARRLRHRSVHVLITRPDGRVYVQRRALHKDCSPGLWDTSAAGHVDLGEQCEVAARRELSEELSLTGLTLVPLISIPASAATGQEFVEAYHAVTVAEPVPDPGEIAAAGWRDPDCLAAAIRAAPQTFTATFRMIFAYFREHGPTGDGSSGPAARKAAEER